MKCSECQFRLEGATFDVCPDCGTITGSGTLATTTDVTNCPHCERFLAAHRQECIWCGQSTVGAASEVMRTEHGAGHPTVSAGPVGLLRVIAVAVAALGLLFGLVVLVVGGGESNLLDMGLGVLVATQALLFAATVFVLATLAENVASIVQHLSTALGLLRQRPNGE